MTTPTKTNSDDSCYLSPAVGEKEEEAKEEKLYVCGRAFVLRWREEWLEGRREADAEEEVDLSR